MEKGYPNSLLMCTEQGNLPWVCGSECRHKVHPPLSPLDQSGGLQKKKNGFVFPSVHTARTCTHQPKSIPSLTFPLATESNTAPRPFSHAYTQCGRELFSIVKTLNMSLLYLTKVVQGKGHLGIVSGLHENQFVSLDLGHHSLLHPL